MNQETLAWQSMAALPLAYPKLTCQGTIKQHCTDFQVYECLPFALTGVGEHVYCYLEKTNCNTMAMIELFAKVLGISPRLFGRAGLKDKVAIAGQWISIYDPKRNVRITAKILAKLRAEQIYLRYWTRHSAKLRPGAIAFNQFRICVHYEGVERSCLEHRLRLIADHGVPNYFGEQRFGRGESNLAVALKHGIPRKQPKRGRIISAVRSYLFNLTLAARVQHETWLDSHDAELIMLVGSHSFFAEAVLSDEVRQRLRAGECHLTGPLCGKISGKMLEMQLNAQEQQVMADNSYWCDLLLDQGVDAARRALRLMPMQLSWQWEDNRLWISFALDAGSYATSVLRECGVRPVLSAGF